MNYESYLMDVLKEQYEDLMKAVYGFDDDNIDVIYLNENSEYYSTDKEFLIANQKSLITEELMDAVYTFITQVSLLEEKDITGLIAYLSTHYFINHYGDKKNGSVLRFLAKEDIKKIVELFFENDDFGREMVTSFFTNGVNDKDYFEKKEQIREDGKSDELDKLYSIAFPERIFTINQKLREVVCNLYNYYIKLGKSDAEALELTWCYFFSDLDPLHELEELGCNKEQKDFYKLYILGLIIGDLYEDTANGPLIDTDNYDGKLAQVIPVLLVGIGRIDVPGDTMVRGRMLKYFILLQDDEEKKRSNRDKTHSDGREYLLKRVNPTYILDEFTF